MKLSRYKDDLLFFMFYNSVGDVLQLAAASELWVTDGWVAMVLTRAVLQVQ
jgi:CCR4-NOT transcription complex subunit 2